MRIEYVHDLKRFTNKKIEHRYGEHDAFVCVDLQEKRVFVSHYRESVCTDAQFHFVFNEHAMGKCINEWMRSHKSQLINLGKLYQISERNGVPCIYSTQLDRFIDDFAGYKCHHNSVIALQESLTRHVMDSPNVWQDEGYAENVFSENEFRINGSMISWRDFSCDTSDDEQRRQFCEDICDYMAHEHKTIVNNLHRFIYAMLKENGD